SSPMQWACRRRLGTSIAIALSVFWGGCGGGSTSTPEEGTGGAEATTGGREADATGGKAAPATGGTAGSATGGTPVDIVDAAEPPPGDDAAGEEAGMPTGDDAQGPIGDPGMGEDQVPDRPLNVDKATPQVYTVHFKPTDADPT